jgi:hypothetical protein
MLLLRQTYCTAWLCGMSRSTFDATDDVISRFDKPAAAGKDHSVLDIIIRTAQHKRKSTFDTVVPPITSSEGGLLLVQELATSCQA